MREKSIGYNLVWFTIIQVRTWKIVNEIQLIIYN